MNLTLKRTPGIYVVGFMAAGKSTIGRHLAHRLGWSFFDTDEEIEAAEKMSIAEIFDGRGEAEFRRIEGEIVKQHVRWIEHGRPAVLALGGGAFAHTPTRELLVGNGISVWLDCPLETVTQRLDRQSHRPLARDRAKLEAPSAARREAYQVADAHVAIESDDPEVAVEATLRQSALQRAVTTDGRPAPSSTPHSRPPIPGARSSAILRDATSPASIMSMWSVRERRASRWRKPPREFSAAGSRPGSSA